MDKTVKSVQIEIPAIQVPAGKIAVLKFNARVEFSSYGGWGDINGQINTEIAGGNQPNIAYCYPDHVAMYNIAKSVVILDNLINSEAVIEGTNEVMGLTAAQKADFIESYYNEGLEKMCLTENNFSCIIIRHTEVYHQSD